MAERGLTKRGNVWWIDKVINGNRLRESTGTRHLSQAKRYLAQRLAEAYQNQAFGEVPEKRFEEAAARYLLECQRRRAIRRDADALAMIMPYIRRRLGCDPHIFVMQAADMLELSDDATVWYLSCSTVRRILRQGEMCPLRVAINGVAQKDPSIVAA